MDEIRFTKPKLAGGNLLLSKPMCCVQHSTSNAYNKSANVIYGLMLNYF